MSIGIYKWHCIPSGKDYIGKSIDLERRKRQFLLFNRKYSKGKLDYARKKYNDESLWEYKVLCYCDVESLNKLEIQYIKEFGTKENGYNSTDGGEGNVGYRHSKEVIEKMSGGNHHQFGKPLSDETKEKISKSLKGKPKPPRSKEHSLKLSLALKNRKPISEETRRKLSASGKGRISGMKGKHHNLETRKRISEHSGNSRELVKIDINTGEVEFYSKIIDATKTGVFSYRSILKALSKKSIYKKNKWVYKEDFNSED